MQWTINKLDSLNDNLHHILCCEIRNNPIHSTSIKMDYKYCYDLIFNNFTNFEYDDIYEIENKKYNMITKFDFCVKYFDRFNNNEACDKWFEYNNLVIFTNISYPNYDFIIDNGNLMNDCGSCDGGTDCEITVIPVLKNHCIENINDYIFTQYFCKYMTKFEFDKIKISELPHELTHNIKEL